MADENHTEIRVPEDGASEPSNGNEPDSVELASTSQKDEDDLKGELFCLVNDVRGSRFLMLLNSYNRNS